MKKQLLFILIVFSGYNLMAQGLPENHSFIVKPIFGAHKYQDQGHLFQDQIYGFDAAYFKDISQNADQWIGFTHAKAYGIGFIFRDLSHLKGAKDTSANAFGQVYGLVAQLDFQLFKIGKAKFNFTPGVGLSYTNKNYFTNYKNRFLGSHLNESLKADLGMELPVSQRLSLMAGGGFLHLSNGGAVIPNGGLNTANVYVGLKLNGPQSAASVRKSSYTTLQKNSFELSFGVGKRGVFEKKDKGYYKSGLYAGYNYYLNDFISLKGGFDAVYYYTVFDPNNFQETFQNYGSSYDKWRTGLSTGLDMNMWRVTVTAQIGKYLHYNRYYKTASWYWAFGPTFNITPNIGIQAKTYMHFAQADFVNYGLVFRL